MSRFVSAALLFLFATTLVATAALAGGLRERQAERKPQIDALLADGTLGINNIGLLEYMDKELHLKVVKAENEDRVTIYRAMARKTNKTINDVGSIMAVKIHQKAPSGTWLQNDKGKWYKKP